VRVRLASVPKSGTGPAGQATTAVNAVAEKKKSLMELPLFQRAAATLGAQLWHLDDEFDPHAAPPADKTEDANEEPEEA
jgi:hypothetical protein